MADKSFRVIAPYITYKTVDRAAGGSIVLGAYQGAVIEDVEQESLDHLLDGGFVEEVSSDKDLYAPLGPEGAMAPTPLSDPESPMNNTGSDSAPAKSASKSDWEDYARSQGASDDDLDGATKDDLIARYGG